jgi:hypothetical protein
MEEEKTRSLTDEERALARWMLENGTPEAQEFLGQLQLAEATDWRCPCGCASFNFRVNGHPAAPPGVHILGEFLASSGDSLSGIFIFSSNGILSGIEVYGLADDAPRVLPSPHELRPYEAGAQK